MNLKSISSLQYFLWASLFLILVFTAIKPGFTGEIGFFKSLLFWSLQIGLLLPLLIIVQDSLQTLSILKKMNVWGLTGLAGAISTLLFVPPALVLDYLFDFDDWTHVKNLSDVLVLAFYETGALILPVSISWIGLNAPRILQLNFEIDEKTTPNESPKEHEKNTQNNNHLFSAIPKAIGTDIIYIASELHYLRVVTTQGDTLILYSLQNAISDLSNTCSGIQTHRSYWVNTVHIDKIVGRSESRHILTRQEHLIPISRRRYKTVKATLNF